VQQLAFQSPLPKVDKDGNLVLDKEGKPAEKVDIEGEIFVKAEWKNNGPVMPPIKSENLFKKPKSAKNRV
jgi:hypothetical protein